LSIFDEVAREMAEYKIAQDFKRFMGVPYLKGNIVIPDPWQDAKGNWLEWIPWDEI